jgi:urease accessory protein
MRDELVEEISMMQLSDSFFPTGLYSASNGLESLFFNYMDNNDKMTGRELSDVIAVNITHQVGPCDCVALANTIQYAKKQDMKSIVHMDEIVFVMKGIKGLRDASQRTGKQFLKIMKKMRNNNTLLNDFTKYTYDDSTPCTYPVVFGIGSDILNIKKEKAMISFLYGFAVSMVGASLRLGMIEHFEGQCIIDRLKPTIIKTVMENKDKKESDMWQFLPHMEIYQMWHEKMDSKMFIT